MKKFLFLLILAFGVQQLNAQLSVTLNPVNVSCNGGCNGSLTAVPSGGTPPYTYAWNPVHSGNPITGLCPGSYTVTVTDGLSNVASATCTITQPLALTISFSTTTISCNGGTGNVTANISGGVPPYNYNWQPGNYSFVTLTNVAAGSYTCTVTDGNACTVTGTCVLTQPTALASSISPSNANPCVGSNVSFTPTVTGGTGPYAYSWTFPGGSPATSTSQTPSVAWAATGTYTVTATITDANGCTSSATTTITPHTPTVVITPSYPTICAGSSLTMTGSGAMTYVWTPSSLTTSSITITPSVTTTYTLTGTDAMGCSGTAVSTVYVNPNPTVTVTPGPTTICTGSNTTLTASGATTYTWVPGNFAGATISVSPASNITYTVTGTAPNGCTGTATTAVNVSAPPTVSNGTIIEAGCNFSNGNATVLASGFAPFTYVWSPSGITTATATGIPAGNYSVDVTDNVGCVTTHTLTVGDSCNFVWPGDANEDAVADNNDILAIGVANGATGTTRANATTNWIGQPSANWGQTLLSGTDYKFVDCNGDGVISPADTNAVVQNFGLMHNMRQGDAPVYDATLPDLSITMGQNSLVSNSPGSLTVALGSSAVPVSNLYGLAFTLNFDPAQIDASTFGMNETGTWMGTPGNDLMGVIMNNGSGTGSVQIALTRLDHQNVNGFGNVANVGFMTTGNLVGTGNSQNVNFIISNVTVISANETPQTVNTVNDSVLVQDPGVLGISPLENSQHIIAYPNPFDESVQIILPQSAKGKACVVTLTDASGRVVLTQQTGNANTMIIQRGQLEVGIYFCTIRSEGQMIGNTKLIVK